MSVHKASFVVTTILTVVSATVDYACVHTNSWKLNTDSHYNTKYSTLTGVSTSQYYSTTTRMRNLREENGNSSEHRRRLQGGPKPTAKPTPQGSQGGSPGGSGSSPTSGSSSTGASAAEGWKVTYTGIPDYDHTFTTSEVSTLNSRPKASTDFKTGATTATAGSYITFGQGSFTLFRNLI